VQAGPARFIGHVRVESGKIGEQSDDFEMVLSARPVDWETAVEVNEACELRVGLERRSVK
jgi:hypothetical protein